MTTSAPLPDPPDDELPHPDSAAVLDRLIAEEMGDHIAAAMREVRGRQEERYRREHPEEGLRERKRRQTRQLISDVATTMFVTHGFDRVKVSEIADRVGVSEKTVYNYFPTKESMALDDADEMVEGIATALRERRPGESITDAAVRALIADMERFDAEADALAQYIPAFVEMMEQTPSLRAAVLELNDRMVRVATEELALAAGVDPRDPEPIVAGRALAGLLDVGMLARVRHTEEGLRGDEMREAVIADVQRAARLLDTGLWSFTLPQSARAKGQVREATRAAEEARVQVLKALREARSAWEQLRTTHRDSAEQIRQAQREARAQGHHADRRAREEARRAIDTARDAHRAEMQEALKAMREQFGRRDGWGGPQS